jgi:DNA uptake protein ComE-like DNA-binding protein
MITYANATTRHTSVSRNRQRGAALVLALSMLAIFGILGTCYLRYMNSEIMETDFDLRLKRAEHLAGAGVQVALEGLRQEVLNPNFTTRKGEMAEFEFDTFGNIDHTESGIAASRELGLPRLAVSRVTIIDESSKLNLNYAPADVLQRLLKLDAATALAIASSVPPAGQPGNRILALDELVTRKLLTQEQFDASVNPTQLTTFSVADGAAPSGYFNVNGASPAVLAAVLNVSEEQAAQVAAKGPFASLGALTEAVSSVVGSPFTGVDSNAALGLKSRCFRIISEGRYAKILDEAAFLDASDSQRERFLSNSATKQIEAVVLFHDDGSHEVLHWSTGRELDSASGA